MTRAWAIVGVLTGAASVEAAEVVVAADGSGDHPTIQAALDAVGPDGIVTVMSGRYSGAGNVALSMPHAELTLRSQDGPEVTILDGGGERIFVLDGDTGAFPVISGFTLTGGVADDDRGGGAMLIEGVAPFVSECTFTGNEATGRGGAVAIYGDDQGWKAAQFRECTFVGNQANEGGAAYAAQPHVRFDWCIFDDNHAVTDGGAVWGWAAHLARCTVMSGSAARGGGVYSGLLMESRTSVFAGNTASEGADWYVPDTAYLQTAESVFAPAGIGGPGTVFDSGSIWADPRFCPDGYGVEPGSPCTPDHNPWGAWIGAREVECVGVPVRRRSWSALKSRLD